MSITTWIITLSLSIAGLAAQAQTVHVIEVMIGGEKDLDACQGFGEVRGLDPQGDNFLAVRTGPGSKFTKIDELHERNQVWLCDERGRWIGIVYGKNCGVSSPIAIRRRYHGPCKSGWVFDKYVKLIAG
jgi:hypothetical protein